MNAASAGQAADFSDFAAAAQRPAVVTMWFVATEHPSDLLTHGSPLGRGFGRKFLALYNPALPVAPIGDFPLNRSAESGPGEFYIGGFAGLVVIQTVLADASRLSELPAALREEIDATDVYAHARDASGFGAIAHWHRGELKRAFSATRLRTLEDIGLPSPAEGDYWAGKHSPDAARAEGVALPFTPAELADAVVAEWLGFDPHDPVADIPVSAFAVDGRKGANTPASPAGLSARSMARPSSESASPSAGHSELTARAGQGDFRGYDDYEIHERESHPGPRSQLQHLLSSLRRRAAAAWSLLRPRRR